jgi:hypothetical protein
MARPNKLTTSIIDTIVEGIENGAWGEQAAVAAGISTSTYYSWKRTGNEAQEKQEQADEWREENSKGKMPDELTLSAYEKNCVKFLQAVTRADAKAENEAAKSLRNANDWRAQLEYLKRRFPDRWTDPVHRVEQTLQHREMTADEVRDLSDDDLDSQLRMLAGE